MMKKQFLRMVSVFLTVAALLSLASCKSGGQSTLRQEFVDNGKNQPYSQNVPLQEMDFDIYFKDIFNNIGEAGLYENLIGKIALPNDIEYYTNKSDSEPALVLKKGTEIFVSFVDRGVTQNWGYGMYCWPDYEGGWRYGEPFTDSFAERQLIGFRDKYFVKTEQLIPVVDEYYRLNECFSQKTAETFRKDSLLIMDKTLYLNGAFCSPDLEANYSRREELSG